MGKSKKRSRASAARLNPLAGGATANRALVKKLDPLLSQLSRGTPSERANALASVSVICEDPVARCELLRQRLIHIVMSQLLNDDNTDIVVESFGLLRNLSLNEGYAVSTNLWRSGIWSSIVKGFQHLSGSLLQCDRVPRESRSTLFEYADNLLSLVVALVNGSDSILYQVLEQDKLKQIFEVLHFLLQCGVDKLPSALLNTVLDLLYDFSSESFEFIEVVMHDQKLAEFVQSLSSRVFSRGNELTNVLILGILLQFSDMDMDYAKADSIIHNVCSSIKSIDCGELENDIKPLNEQLILNQAPDIMLQMIKDYTNRRASSLMKLQSIEIAVDILTATIEIVASIYENEQNQGKLPESLSKTLIDFIPPILVKLQPHLTSRILMSWNNLLWLYVTLDVNFFQIYGELAFDLWRFVNQLPQNGNIDIQLGKWSVVWVLLKTVSLQEDPNYWLNGFQIQNNIQFVQAIISLYDSSFQDNDKLELCEKLIGTLAIFACFQRQIEVNRIIGKFILDQLISDGTPASLLVELTSSLFDIYADSSFDYDEPVYVAEGFQSVIISKIVPQLKRRFRLVDRNKDASLKNKCTECFNILDSFIHYKQNERA